MSGDKTALRFALLQLVRLAGAMTALAGVVVLSHGMALTRMLPDWPGYAMVVAGAAGFFAGPVLLVKGWKRRT